MRTFITLAPFLFLISAHAAAQGAAGVHLQRHVYALAADSMQGRATATIGEEKAAAYLAAQYRALGLQPLGHSGEYSQHFPIAKEVIDAANSYLRIGDQRFGFAEAFIRRGGGGKFRPQHFQGELVVVRGYYDAATPVDTAAIRDAIVYYDMPKTAAGKFGPRAWRSLFSLAGLGAGTILIPSTKSDSAWTAIAENPSAYLMPTEKAAWSSWLDERKETTSISFFEVSPEVERLLPPGTNSPGDQLRVTGTDTRVELKTEMKLNELAYGRNVVGYLPGNDPGKQGQAIIVTAHYDGLGVIPRGVDTIHNGADDNATGVAAMLEFARMALSEKPAHTLIFLATSGEEKGLWGSNYFVKHFPHALYRLLFNVNIDMIGRPHVANSVYVVGLSELAGAADLLPDKDHGITPLGDTQLEQAFPRQHLYYRSDHINFVEAGIPALLFFSGLHDDYHEPSDEASSVDFAYLRNTTDFIWALIRKVDSRTTAPAFSRPPAAIMKDWHLSKNE